MEKILLAIDSDNVNMNSLDFACYLARLTKSKITGVFLDDQVLAEKPEMKALHGMPYVETVVQSSLPDYKERKKRIQTNIVLFESACENRSVRCEMHRHKGAAIRELIEETRYADLLVISATSFSETFDGTPTKFVRDILETAKCPVVISPESHCEVGEIVFTYDGSMSAIFALRQFTYLFPEYKNKKATVVEVNKRGSAPPHEKQRIIEWLNAHYADVTFINLEGKPRDEIIGYLLSKKNLFVVMGSYGRGMLSNFFRTSTAQLVMKTLSLPIFIAHL